MQLSTEQVADALDLPAETVERWVRQGRIPFQRQGGTLVFRQRVLERWASQHKLPFRLAAAEETREDSCQEDTLLEAMRRGGVYYDIEGADTETTLRRSVAELKAMGLKRVERELLFERLMEREAMASTGVGKGVAIPHPRTPLDKAVPRPTICTFFLKHPTPYQAIDDKPVFILFLLLSPSTRAHLHCLSRLAFCVRNDDFVSFLQSRPTPEALLERVQRFEKRFDTP